jgi:hypothetical protein
MSETPSWIRHRPDGRQSLAALGVGLGVGLVVGGIVTYLARLFVAREPIEPAPRTRVARLAARGTSGEASSGATEAR